MLFRTVYGPELDALYRFILNANQTLSREIIHSIFVPRVDDGSTQNTDDAILFLVACGLIAQDKAGDFHADAPSDHLPFRLLVLYRLRDIAKGNSAKQNKSDPLYWTILDGSVDSNEKDKSITQTIAYAYELQNLILQKGLPSHVTPMAIVQGYDADSIAYCAQELKDLNYSLYGIGSLAPLRKHGPIMDRVMAAVSILGAENVHIFGVTVIQTILEFHKLGIHSIDSARPAKAAAYNEILYSRPFRRCGIYEPEKEVQDGRLPLNRRLTKPLPCDCPVCERDSGSIMVVGKRENIRNRALHNYFHLKQVVIER